MKAQIHLLCAVMSFVATFPAQLYLIGGWLNNAVVPVTIDNKPSWNTAVLLPGFPVINNILLVTLFGLQHSLMARKKFKSIVNTYFPENFDRVLYNYATMIVIFLMCFLWDPLPYQIWSVSIPWLKYSIIMLRLCLLWLVLRAVGALDRLSLYGIRQALAHLNNKEQPKATLVTTGLYKMVRHPAMSFLIGAFFISHTMSVGQLIFAITMTIYIVVSVLYFEECDLMHQFGSQYEKYKKTTPAFIPSLWRHYESSAN